MLARAPRMMYVLYPKLSKQSHIILYIAYSHIVCANIQHALTVLYCIVLCCAMTRCAVLCCVVLCCAVLCVMCSAVMCCAALRWTASPPSTPTSASTTLACFAPSWEGPSPSTVNGQRSTVKPFIAVPLHL
jgi:hypothetical protein